MVNIAAVVLAAGFSRRMGRPKMILPWGDTTVIGQVVEVLQQAGLEEIVVVTGSARQEVELALRHRHVRCIFNQLYTEDNMAISLQVGLSALADSVEAALVVLGDQPQIACEVVARLVQAFEKTRAKLIVPSYQQRRGHPWLVARSAWPAILALGPQETLRSFLNAYEAWIEYLPVESDTVLRDLDTPEDYSRERPLPA